MKEFACVCCCVCSCLPSCPAALTQSPWLDAAVCATFRREGARPWPSFTLLLRSWKTGPAHKSRKSEVASSPAASAERGAAATSMATPMGHGDRGESHDGGNAPLGWESRVPVAGRRRSGGGGALTDTGEPKKGTLHMHDFHRARPARKGRRAGAKKTNRANCKRKEK